MTRAIWIAVFVCLSVVAQAQLFSWPVDNPSVGQAYACDGCVPPEKMSDRYQDGTNMHTGIDMKPAGYASGYTTPVRAAADGTIVKVVTAPYSHLMGNVVIISHANGLYTLYGHLHSFASGTYVGAWVYRGQQIGIMGDTGNVTGPHLHFEIKTQPVLGSASDDGPYWGYTPGHPDNHGYRDPRLTLLGASEENLMWVMVNPPPGALNVRNAPGVTYYGTVPTKIIDKIGENQLYVATKRVWFENRYWYFLQLPSQNTPMDGSDNQGPFGGWVADLAQPSFGAQVQSTTDGLRVRSGASTAYMTLGKVYYGQRFVRSGPVSHGSGCVQPWYKIYIPGDGNVEFGGIAQGWMCGDYLNVF